MKSIFIECGIDFGHSIQNKFFWPILKAKALDYQIKSDKKTKYSLIFTSKTSVEFFLRNNSHILKQDNLEHICSVGEKTALLLSINMKNEHAQIRFPSKEGLLNLLNEFDFSKESHVYVLTAENGKTDEILSKIKHQKNYILEKISIYKIEINHSPFLKNLFSTGDKNNYVFQCKSGQTLKAILNELVDYFGCGLAKNLPKNIFFSVEKLSTLKVAHTYEVIDKLVK
jgi:uroporphyrinogen-III synthase